MGLFDVVKVHEEFMQDGGNNQSETSKRIFVLRTRQPTQHLSKFIKKNSQLVHYITITLEIYFVKSSYFSILPIMSNICK